MDLTADAVAICATPGARLDDRQKLAMLRQVLLEKVDGMPKDLKILLLFGVLRHLLTDADRLKVEQDVVCSTRRTLPAVRTAVSRLLAALVPFALDTAFAVDD